MVIQPYDAGASSALEFEINSWLLYVIFSVTIMLSSSTSTCFKYFRQLVSSSLSPVIPFPKRQSLICPNTAEESPTVVVRMGAPNRISPDYIWRVQRSIRLPLFWSSVICCIFQLTVVTDDDHWQKIQREGNEMEAYNICGLVPLICSRERHHF